MTIVPKSHNERAHYFLETAETARKKAQMYDKLIESKQGTPEERKEFKEQSRQWWTRQEEYTLAAGKKLEIKQEGKSIDDIVERAKEIFK